MSDKLAFGLSCAGIRVVKIFGCKLAAGVAAELGGRVLEMSILLGYGLLAIGYSRSAGESITRGCVKRG
jgi:hypothetical protein